MGSPANLVHGREDLNHEGTWLWLIPLVRGHGHGEQLGSQQSSAVGDLLAQALIRCPYTPGGVDTQP